MIQDVSRQNSPLVHGIRGSKSFKCLVALERGEPCFLVESIYLRIKTKECTMHYNWAF